MVRTLVVDDDDALRVLLRLTLDDSGDYTVVGEARDGRQALEEAKRHQPDLILLDLKMPVMDGFTALPLLRAACPDAVIVALSMLQRAENEGHVTRLGAAGFIDKALPADLLLVELGRILAKARSVSAKPSLRRPAAGTGR